MKGPLNNVVGDWTDTETRDPIYVDTLHPEQETLSAYGRPQDAYPCIRVAGTNGKGSTTRMIAWTLKHAGFDVGMMSNVSSTKKLTDTITVNGTPIDEAKLREMCTTVSECAHPDVEPYGVRTIAALEWFRQKEVDVVLLEAGVGSQYDVTNLVESDVYAVTNVGADHAASMGGSEESIAADLASAARSSEVFVTNAAPTTVERMQEHTDNEIVEAEAVFTLQQQDDGIGYVCTYGQESYPTSIHVSYQQENINTAWCALQESSLSVEKHHFVQMLNEFQFAGRGEFFDTTPAILLDGAHNQAGISHLVQTLSAEQRPITTIFTALADKPWQAMFGQVRDVSERVITTDPQGSTRTSHQETLREVSDYHIGSPKKALQQALNVSPEDGLIVVTGSLYMIREVRLMVVDS